jgi:hypothetical protein
MNKQKNDAQPRRKGIVCDVKSIKLNYCFSNLKPAYMPSYLLSNEATEERVDCPV